MTYLDAEPLSDIERQAWQRGDSLTANLAAQAIEGAEAIDRAEIAENALENIRDLFTESNWRTGEKAELRTLLDAIYAKTREA